MITAADLAAAWASGYWHGTSHTGALSDAVVDERNPHSVHVAEDASAEPLDHSGHVAGASTKEH